MSTVTITLEYPVTHDGETITELSMRRPTVGDNLAVRKNGGSDAEQETRLIANLAEIPPDCINKMDMKDYGKAQRVLAGFLS